MVEAQTFLSPVQVTHKQYEALRAYYVDGLSATEAAQRFGYTVSSFYSLHLENNWSGTRHQALSSILAVLAQDPDSGIITYADTNIRHDKKNQVVLEFLDFYSTDNSTELKYLVFDSKFTTYENLRQLDEKEVKFITIRRRGERIIQELESLPTSAWKTLRVPKAWLSLPPSQDLRTALESQRLRPDAASNCHLQLWSVKASTNHYQ